MKSLLLILCLLGSGITAGCGRAPSAAGDRTGPLIVKITTSNKSFSIDCAPTSVTVTARITDQSGIGHVQLWYRVGSDRPFVPLDMAGKGENEFTATVKGPALPPDRYGALEFYIAAEDAAGNKSKSPMDSSVQFLPCVSH